MRVFGAVVYEGSFLEAAIMRGTGFKKLNWGWEVLTMARQHSLRLFLCFVLTALSSGSASSAQAGKAAPAARPGGGYTLNFSQGGEIAWVFDGNGKIVAAILNPTGQKQLVPAPGVNPDTLKKPFDDWKASVTGTQAPQIGPGAPAPTDAPAVSAGVTFSPDNEPTVTRPDGVTLAFAGKEIKITGYQNRNYILRNEKATAGRFLRNLYAPTHMGTGFAGGEQYLIEGGQMFFDSAINGVNVANGTYGMDKPLLLPKQLSQMVMDAVAQVRAIPGHESFAPPGYDAIKQVSQYKLKADGSQH